jgi:peptidase M28-like protein/PA domain-containing protein
MTPGQKRSRRAVALAAALVVASSCSRDGVDGRLADGPAAACSQRDWQDSGKLPQVDSATLGSHLRFLADDSLEGRGTGTRGFDLAARYVADCFTRLGLEPAGTEGYLQPVPLRHGRITEASFTLEGPRGRRQLVSERDFILFPDMVRPEISVTAPLVLAGFGATAPERGYDDYRTVDARGKIVVILRGGPTSFPPTERAHYATPRARYENAVRHGAVGVLTMSTRSETAPWASVVRQLRPGDMAWLDPAGKPSDNFPELKAQGRLSDSAAMRLFEGAPRSYNQVLTAAEKGMPPAFDLPLRATIRTVTAHDRVESPNIAGLLPGSDPKLRDQVVVYSAHLDHLGIGEPIKGDSIYNGALDNALGSAAMLEVARAFASLPSPPRRSVLFLAVTAEEKGLLGSDYFAEHPTVPRERIVANLNLDGLAVLYPLRELVPMGAEHSTLGAVVKQAADQLGIRLVADPFPEEVFFVRSDQYSFVRRGVPSLFLFMGLKSDSGVDAAARFQEFGRTRYHLPQDDLSQAFDLESGARHAQLNFLVGLETANADQAPAWKAGDFFARTFGRDRAAGAAAEP